MRETGVNESPSSSLGGSDVDEPLAAHLERLERERQDADRRYNDALTAVDRALPAGVPAPSPTPPADAEQLAALKAEQGGEESLAELLAEVEASFSNAAARICTLATANFDTPRFVGRKQLPTSIGGALIHVADHTQRHTGQIVTTAKVLLAQRA